MSSYEENGNPMDTLYNHNGYEIYDKIYNNKLSSNRRENGTHVKQFDRVLLHPDAIFNVSSAHAADIIAFVEAIAGMMFFTTPCRQHDQLITRATEIKLQRL